VLPLILLKNLLFIQQNNDIIFSRLSDYANGIIKLMAIAWRSGVYFASPSVPGEQKVKTAIKILFLTFVLFIAFLGVVKLGEIRKPIIIEGEVKKKITECSFDGLCAFIVKTTKGKDYTIIYGGGLGWCQKEVGIVEPTIREGDYITALARRESLLGGPTLTLCGNSKFYIRKKEQ